MCLNISLAVVYQVLRLIRVQCAQATRTVPAANPSQPQLVQPGILVMHHIKSLQQLRALIGQLLRERNDSYTDHKCSSNCFVKSFHHALCCWQHNSCASWLTLDL